MAALGARRQPMSPAATMDAADALGALEHAADDLFYEYGVAGVSVAQIRDASGVSLRRLYSLCPSKDALVSVWLRYRHTTWMAGFTNAVNEHLDAGHQPVDAIFDALAEWMTETDFRGCGFINTHAGSALTDEHTQIIRDHKRTLGDYLATLTPHGDAIAVLVDGAIVQASIFASVEPIELARGAASALLKVPS
jgi:AcrR family transcriptional regulator